MKCPTCKNVITQPIELVNIYTKNRPSLMNKVTRLYTIIGGVCPLCLYVEIGEPKR
jgi:hypothetical protein